jgi:hypothetical protein
VPCVVVGVASRAHPEASDGRARLSGWRGGGGSAALYPFLVSFVRFYPPARRMMRRRWEGRKEEGGVDESAFRTERGGARDSARRIAIRRERAARASLESEWVGY